MEDEVFEQRLREIASKILIPQLPQPAADACWFDGQRCPYGLPGGTFKLRPEAICHTGGCGKFKNNEDLDSFLEYNAQKNVQDRLDEIVSQDGVTLASELKVVAEEDCWTEEQKEILRLVADLIAEDRIQNKIILRKDDLTA